MQIVTITWMIVEAVGSLFAARRAHSPALFAFGGDSVIELLSAAMVLWGFQAPATQGHTERNAGRVVGGLLFALAAYVVATSFVSLEAATMELPVSQRTSINSIVRVVASLN